jgi:ERCC4-type nuclease
MILVDYREDEKAKGSPGLWQDLRKTKLPIEQTTLDAGDLMFVGNGPDDSEVTVGVEFKKIRDLLSSIRSGRMQEQIERMQPYDYRFLLIEGEWRNEGGMVCVRSGFRDWSPAPGRMSSAELDKRLLGFNLRAGVVVWPTLRRTDTIGWLESLYRDFTDKKWDDHTGHLAFHVPSALVPISDKRDVFARFPGIGVKGSLIVERHFGGSIRRAVAARADEWAEVEGIGKKGAARIDEFLK